ncbi:hypothetical protein Hypma_005623 [Hypsizygus marmoreus]|uniref:Uncharacterized protein n=1 Tax=Hypsizygus marmoreus TaxID=39966 RepID=A0A369K400_HYPMA|nr:hypothetical protein Hypma_005623 [Hypsizygus marmoreus]
MWYMVDRVRLIRWCGCGVARHKLRLCTLYAHVHFDGERDFFDTNAIADSKKLDDIESGEYSNTAAAGKNHTNADLKKFDIVWANHDGHSAGSTTFSHSTDDLLSCIDFFWRSISLTTIQYMSLTSAIERITYAVLSSNDIDANRDIIHPVPIHFAKDASTDAGSIPDARKSFVFAKLSLAIAVRFDKSTELDVVHDVGENKRDSSARVEDIFMQSVALAWIMVNVGEAASVLYVKSATWRVLVSLEPVQVRQKDFEGYRKIVQTVDEHVAP